MAGVNREAVERLNTKLEENADSLNLSDVGDICGQPFWELIVMLLLDAQDAARAIQLATARIRGNAEFNGFEEEDDEDLDDDDE